MTPPLPNDTQWQRLLNLLPQEREQAAHRLGAFQRKRQIKDADTLLRLLFVYAWGGLSLRNTVAWAALRGVANLSDMALLERFQKTGDWLCWLLGQLLAKRAALHQAADLPYRVRLVDASVVCREGSTGTDWRVHLGMHLGTQTIDYLELTDQTGGETFTRFPLEAGELLVGDRGYGHRAGLCHVVSLGGEALVRFSGQNLPLQHADATPFDLVAALQALPQGATGDFLVQTAPDKKQKLVAVRGRVIACPRSLEAAEAARRQVRQNAKKKGHTPDARTLLLCDYLLLFTTLPETVDAETLLASIVCAGRSRLGSSGSKVCST
jgi:hypothetical protein